MFISLRVKPFKLTPEEAARAIEEQEVALDELVESGRMLKRIRQNRCRRVILRQCLNQRRSCRQKQRQKMGLRQKLK